MSKINRQVLKGALAALLSLFFLGGASVRGQGCPPRYAQDFDLVTAPVLPADWTATQGMNVTGAPLWVTSTITPDTPPNDVFSSAPDNILDNRLAAPPISAGFFDNTVTFNHSYDLEDGFDGAVLEISTPSINGGAFTDVTDPAVGGTFGFGQGYNSTISAASQSPIAGQMAWSGNSNGYISVHLFLGFIGPSFFDNVIMRFRLATDNSGASAGWRVDTFRWHHNECSPPSPTPTIPPTPTATPTATVTATATVPPTATPSPSDCPGICGSPTPFPTVTPTATPSATPTPSPTPAPSPAQPLNISTRLRVETGDRVIIGGFIITGNVPKKVAIRGIGPSLANSGLSDVLADPTLELYDSDSVLMQNDDWQDDPAQAAQLTALGLALQNPKESGIVVTLSPGRYTAVMAGKNQTSGIGLVEIYDADPAAASQLANISTRGFVRTGDNVMIGGFILGHGSGSANVIIRGIGPTLSQFMLMDVLADPILELRDANGALLIANDDWQDDPASAAQLIAYGFQPSDPVESAIFATLAPGAFTAIVAGKNGDVGSALVEVYNVHPRVTTTVDSGSGSLRDAIARASDGDTIQFDTALQDQAINLTSGELVIDKSITISGFLFNHVTVQPSVGGGRIFHIMPGRTVTLEGLTIRGGGGQSNFSSGGGVLSDNATLTLRYCTVKENDSFGHYGGGIFSVGSSATLTIVNSSVTNNRVSGGPGEGGGINGTGVLTIINSTVSGNNSRRAGGIFSNGTLTITNSTISGNSGGAEGGGILCGGSATITNSTVEGNTSTGTGGGIKNSATLTISNSTITGNTASSNQSGRGGGIFSDFSATLTINHSTFSGNSADGSGASINLDSGTLHLGNTVLRAGPSGANLVNNSGAVISHGYNLSSDNGGGFLNAIGDQLNTDPMLGPLQNNSGRTFTHALLTGSPAINAGDPNFVPPPFTDQRDFNRVENGRIDIGSFELQP